MIDRTTPTLGKLLDGPMPRDAIHIAVACVKVAHRMDPSQRAHFVPGHGCELVEGCRDNEECIGLIDPFLREAVDKGRYCWLFLFPGTITNLRHVWSHPAFQAKVPGVSE